MYLYIAWRMMHWIEFYSCFSFLIETFTFVLTFSFLFITRWTCRSWSTHRWWRGWSWSQRRWSGLVVALSQLYASSSSLGANICLHICSSSQRRLPDGWSLQWCYVVLPYHLSFQPETSAWWVESPVMLRSTAVSSVLPARDVRLMGGVSSDAT